MQRSISFPSSLALLSAVLITLIFALSICAAPKGGAVALRLGFVNLDTAKADANADKPATFIGGVVVRFFDRATGHESFAITDDYGMGWTPLRAGNYCMEAYGTSGKRLKLDTRLTHGEPPCFLLRAGEVADVGVTLAYDEDYKPQLPSRGLKERW